MSTSSRRIGKYELREHLGRGGMAEVWKALDTQLGRFVAIKMLHPDLQSDPQFVIRFEREARVIASLHHPNIIQIYDFHIAQPPEVETTLAYMVMDYVDGPTLAHYLHHTAHIGMFLPPTQLLQLFTRPRRHLAEQSEFAAKTVETFTQQDRPLLVSFLRKREAQIDLAGATEICGEQVSEFRERTADAVCHARR